MNPTEQQANDTVTLDEQPDERTPVTAHEAIIKYFLLIVLLRDIYN